MKSLIITKEQLTNYVNESPIKNKEFSTEALFVVINKIIDDEKIDRYSKYIADKDNPNVRGIFVKITSLVLPKVNKGAGIIIDNYTGRIYQKNYTIEPKDLDKALVLFNSMNSKGLLYHFFDSSNEYRNIQTKEINQITPYEQGWYKLYETHGDTFILPHTKRIIDIKPECIDITIGAKLLVDKYLPNSEIIEHKVSLEKETLNNEVKINPIFEYDEDKFHINITNASLACTKEQINKYEDNGVCHSDYDKDFYGFKLYCETHLQYLDELGFDYTEYITKYKRVGNGKYYEVIPIDSEIKQQNKKQTSKQVTSLFDFYGIDVA